MTKNSIFFALSLSLVLLTGCGDKVGLKGKATFNDDGSPVPTGTVCFETDTYLARGDLKPDGTFTVGSLTANDGIPPGKYRVYISGAQKSIGQDKEGMDLYESLIDEKFASGTTSGITIDVTPSTKNLDIKVDRYVPPAGKK